MDTALLLPPKYSVDNGQDVVCAVICDEVHSFDVEAPVMEDAGRSSRSD